MKKSKQLPTKPDPTAPLSTQLAQMLYCYLRGPGHQIPEKWQDDNAAALEPLLAAHGFATVRAVMDYLFAAEECWVDKMIREPDPVAYFVEHFDGPMLPSYSMWLGAKATDRAA